MSYEACILAVKSALPELKDDEIASLMETLDKYRVRAQKDGRALDLAAATRLATEELVNEAKATRLVKARESMLNGGKKVSLMSYIESVFSDHFEYGLEARLTGIQLNRAGARDSAENMQRSVAGRYQNGLTHDLNMAGLKELFVSNAMELEVAKALRAIDTGEKVSVPAEATKMAEIIRKWQSVARLEQNREGAWIGTLSDYIARQSHDILKMKKAAGMSVPADDPRHFDAWRDKVLPWLDWERTNTRQFSANNEFLREVYVGLTTGDHLKTGIDGAEGFTGPRNIARSASAERVLHFKDAESWLAYNREFGVGNLSESVIASLDRAAHNVGLMHFWGTNPRMMLHDVADELGKKLRGPGDTGKLSRLNDAVHKLDRQMSHVDGSANVPESARMAEVGTQVRAIQTMMKLPVMLVSQLGDLATFASDVRFATGKSFLGGLRESIMGLGANMTPAERAKFMDSVGIFADGMIHDLSAKFGANEPLSGRVAAQLQTFFGLTGATWWSRLQRNRAAESYAHSMAEVSGTSFGNLNKNMQRSLRVYGITEADWNLIRANVQKFGDNKYLVADGIGGEPERKYRAFLTDRVGYAQLQPTAKTNYYMMWGTDLKRGTYAREALQFIMQFKGYPTAFGERVLGREIHGRGENYATLGEFLTGGRNGELVALAQMMVWTTALGYLSMTAKELVKGKEPRDVTDPAVAWSTFMAAAMQGGGAAYYSDFLFGQANKGGAGTAAKLIGPTMSDFADIADMAQRTIRGEQGGGEAFRKALKMAAGVNPYSSVVVNGYPRIALDYLFLYRLQEEISPGYMRRQEQRMEKENAQSFMFPPTQYAR